MNNYIKVTIFILIILLITSCNNMISHDCSERNWAINDVIISDTVSSEFKTPIELAYGYSSSGRVTSINYEFKNDSLILRAYYCITTRIGYVSTTEYHYDTLSSEIRFPNKGIYYLCIKGNDEYQKTVVVE